MNDLILTYENKDYSYSQVIDSTSTQKRPTGTYGIVNPDYQQVWYLSGTDGMMTLKKLDRNSRNEILMGKKQGANYNQPSGQAVPATARFLDDTFVNFTKELQEWFHYELNGGKTGEAQAKIDFKNCFRDNAWITNKAGSWTRADYINNNGFPPYIQIQPMATGGTVLKIVEETIYRREPALLIEAINPLDNYSEFNPNDYRWLFFRPTNSARVKIVDKKGYTIRYDCWYEEILNSWYGEKMEMPVFGFIKNSKSSTGWCNLIEKSRVRILSNDEAIPNPYIMRDGRQIPNFYDGF